MNPVQLQKQEAPSAAAATIEHEEQPREGSGQEVLLEDKSDLGEKTQVVHTETQPDTIHLVQVSGVAGGSASQVLEVVNEQEPTVHPAKLPSQNGEEATLVAFNDDDIQQAGLVVEIQALSKELQKLPFLNRLKTSFSP